MTKNASPALRPARPGLLRRTVARAFLDALSRIAVGSIRVVTPEGHVHHFGSGAPEAELVIRDWAAVTAAKARGDIGFGEAYALGLWDSPDIEAFCTLAIRNAERLGDFYAPRGWRLLWLRAVDKLLRANSRRGAARNIRAHYDAGNEFFRQWLDAGMHYSCALFAGDGDSLEQAQLNKCDRILARLGPGTGTLLEIGCGWGGFAERAADYGHAVTGITISLQQKAYADARLDGRAEIRLQDYRDVEGMFDNIVSIEMIEAVGERYWPTYFATLARRLRPGGRAVIQAITVSDDYFPVYRRNSDYIRHYTFPGGMLLSPGVIAQQARRAGLAIVERFTFGQHYARTLREWMRRMQARADRLQTYGYGEPALRPWRFYLGACAAAFAVGHTDVSQVVLEHA
ncbi:MAG: cyclopropane-fatty-acyl-phospholipid synthase [Rhodothalassiaceae bacterium]|nr:MAG: cyclopropane-fatty-acyl-phospholipid synthase [Rhodothalassiaceae bacterium]